VPDFELELTQIVAELNRAVPTPQEHQPLTALNPASLDQLLIHSVHEGASDLLLIAEVPVTLRIAGSSANQQVRR